MKLPESVNILLLGGGGREHAFAWRISQSPRLGKLFIAPGNAGTASCGVNVDIQPTNFASVKQFIILNSINLVVVGPEEPLVKGLADFIREDNEIHHVPVIGPDMAGARLEGSKDYAKAFMQEFDIPTASYRSFTKETLAEGVEFMKTLRPPYVLKADGLAAGKGVVISPDLEEAARELEEMLSGKFGTAGSTVVIEEYLDGIECSVFVATDGKDYVILPTAKDYKRIGEGDTGPNTGGMGAVSPVPFADEEFMRKVRDRIVEPTMAGLQQEGIKYVGFIFIGLMNCGGDPYVIEYNVRMGDPETEVVLPRITSDIVDLFEAMAFGKLSSYEVVTDERTAMTVVCVAGGYPGDYKKGDRIDGLSDIPDQDTILFHAGTKGIADKVFTNGGRVLTVTALGSDIPDARGKCYDGVGRICYDGKYFRRDIGEDLMK